MRILIRVDYGAKIEKVRAAWGHRESFWTTYNSLSFAGKQEPTEEEIRAKEEQIRTEFPWILRRKLLSAFAGEGELTLPKKSKLTTLRKALQIVVSKIEYNSLDIVLDVVGIDSKDVYDAAFSLIEIYAPAALNEAIGNSRVNFTHDFVRLDFVRDDISDEQPDKVSRVWSATNLAWLLPILLSLAVLCMAYLLQAEYLRDLKAEQRAYAERAIKENDTIYRLLLDMVKSSREHEEALVRAISEFSSKSSKNKKK